MQSTQMIIPIMTVVGAVVVAVISSYATYLFTRKMRLEAEWRKDKLLYYAQLIDSITEIMSSPRDYKEVYKQYAQAYNTISLIAPQAVANIIAKEPVPSDASNFSVTPGTGVNNIIKTSDGDAYCEFMDGHQ